MREQVALDALTEFFGRAFGTVAAGTLPEADAFEAVHVGSYETLTETYAALQDRIREAGQNPSATMWEFYLNGPSTEPDPSKWQTRVVWPVT